MRLPFTTLALACALLQPSLALAQEQPTLDPDSPAGVEYQLPLDRAREDAVGGGGSGGGGGGFGGSAEGTAGAGAGLFGSGIKPQGDPDGEAARARSGDAAGSGAARGVGGQDALPLAAEAGISANNFVIPGIALGVLLLGGGLGLALRRGLRESPSS